MELRLSVVSTLATAFLIAFDITGHHAVAFGVSPFAFGWPAAASVVYPFQVRRATWTHESS